MPDLYSALKPLLFSVSPETAHQLTLKLLDLSYQTGFGHLLNPKLNESPVSVMGLEFKNRVGLAAGLDKNGDHIAPLAQMGFGFLEIGTVTPRPQPGNPKPRLFRVPEHNAIINRMGFNNKGIDYLLEQVERSPYAGILGINIGKNFDTPIKNAVDDYLIGLQKSYSVASYITINISSPNTQNLRQLQQGEEIKGLLSALKEEQLNLQQSTGKYTPLVVKIAPDLNDEEIRYIAHLINELDVDGVIATNTTIDRESIKDHPLAEEKGGLSGAPVKEQSTHVVKILHQELGEAKPIIAAGGILSVEDAQEKLAAGASLVQVYSGLIYRGPRLVEELVRAL